MDQVTHSTSITPEVLEQVLQKTREIKEIIGPVSVSLTPKQRHDVIKMGEKTVDFVQKAFQYAVENPSLVPNMVNMAEFRIDHDDAVGLHAPIANVRQVADILGDIQMLAGSEAMITALCFYRYLKMQAASNVPGAKALYDDLRSRFPHHGRASSASKNATAAA